MAAPIPLRLITFGGGYALPAWTAAKQGYFARHGLAVDIVHTPDSVHLMSGLLAGHYDVAVTAIDNLIAYQEGQGEAPVTGEVDLAAFMGLDQGFLHLMAAPDVRTVADLRGRRLAVDALTTGYAFILREMLARAGVGEEEVTFARTGGGPSRMRELVEGRHAGGLLATPLDLIAEARGLRRLGSARELLGRYQGRTAFARRAWLATHGAAAVGLVRAYRDAIAWLVAPANRNAAVDLLRAGDASLGAELAGRALDVLLAPGDGFHRDLALDVEGIRTVLALRSRYGTPRIALDDPFRYLDTTIREKAFST